MARSAIWGSDISFSTCLMKLDFSQIIQKSGTTNLYIGSGIFSDLICTYYNIFHAHVAAQEGRKALTSLSQFQHAMVGLFNCVQLE